MFNIVLYEPEIPPNTGNVIRLSVNTGCKLHLIEPLGFSLDNKQMKRAGLDYKDKSVIYLHSNWNEYLSSLTNNFENRIFLCSTKVQTKYSDVKFQPGDSFVFGPETRGLPEDVLNSYPDSQKICIPMTSNGRSLNLATAVSIIVYEAWRQNDFATISISNN